MMSAREAEVDRLVPRVRLLKAPTGGAGSAGVSGMAGVGGARFAFRVERIGADLALLLGGVEGTTMGTGVNRESGDVPPAAAGLRIEYDLPALRRAVAEHLCPQAPRALRRLFVLIRKEAVGADVSLAALLQPRCVTRGCCTAADARPVSPTASLPVPVPARVPAAVAVARPLLAAVAAKPGAVWEAAAP
jgi:hypothetical protein